MRCDEVQERFVELLYNERGTPSAGPELQAHVDSCPACQTELSDLRAVRSSLKAWKDEPPLRSVSIVAPPAMVASIRPRFSAMRIARFAAIAAMLVLAFLAVANAEITWNQGGFSFRTHTFWRPDPGPDPANYYKRAEVRAIIKAVADDSEARMNETMYLMINRMLDTIEEERRMDLRFINSRAAQVRSKN
jgi:hypothetical protein